MSNMLVSLRQQKLLQTYYKVCWLDLRSTFYGSQGISCHYVLISSQRSLWTRQHKLHPDKSLDPVDSINPVLPTPAECLNCGMHVLLTHKKWADQWKQMLCYTTQVSCQILLRLPSRKILYLIRNMVSCTHFCIKKIIPRYSWFCLEKKDHLTRKRNVARINRRV